jgi:hypothetical protein
LQRAYHSLEDYPRNDKYDALLRDVLVAVWEKQRCGGALSGHVLTPAPDSEFTH